MYKWFEEIPSKPRKFLGIRIGTTNAISEGWSIESNGFRYPSSYFKDYNLYKIDEMNKKIWCRPSISIRFGNKDSTTKYFDSNPEAQRYVDELMSSSKNKFQIIIND
jgi:hypothetical protein